MILIETQTGSEFLIGLLGQDSRAVSFGMFFKKCIKSHKNRGILIYYRDRIKEYCLETDQNERNFLK